MPAPLTGTNLIRPSNASTIASLCWTVGSASSSRGQATSRPGTGTFWKEAGHRTADGCWGMGAKLLHWSSTQPLQSRCQFYRLCVLSGSPNFAGRWDKWRLNLSQAAVEWRDPKVPPCSFRQQSCAFLFFFLRGSWAIGPARCFRAGGLLTLQEPGRQLQKAKLQCIPIFQNRKNKTNQSRCSNM